jgi:beta-glucosidase
LVHPNKIIVSIAVLLSALCTHAQNPYNLPWNNLSYVQADSVAQSIMKQMTLREKVKELHGKGVNGFKVLFGGMRMPVVQAGGNKRLHIPPILFTDGPRGIVTAKATDFPVTMARGATWDVNLEKQVGEVMGIEARSNGANYSGAVCINLLRHPFWGRAQETYGEDPYLLGEMGSALVGGIQKHNVMACVKHFALNSIEESRYLVDVKVDQRTLHEVYLPHFKKCIDSGALSMMSAYNKVNGEYCGHNKTLLTDIARNEWGFTGTISSDWEKGLRNTLGGIEGGLNIEMSRGVFYSYKRIKRLLDDKKISEAQVDSLVLPTIRTKLQMYSRTDNFVYAKKLIAAPTHVQLAQQVAEKSAVLLKNENQILPFDKTKVKRILVTGTLADYKNDGDHGSSRVRQKDVTTPLHGLKEYLKGSGIEVLYAETVNDAKQMAGHADVVLVMAGFKIGAEGEYIIITKKKDRLDANKKRHVIADLGKGGDRDSMGLPSVDVEFINAVSLVNKNVVVGLVSSTCFTFGNWADNAQGILFTNYSGMRGSNALARILFGDVNPSGKLTFTIPKKESDLPYFNNRVDSITYGYYHGYTLFDKMNLPVQYPFGYGLSYTSFSYSKVNVVTSNISNNGFIKVTADVTNTGKVVGEEVAQLYIGFPHCTVDRPVKLLKGFKRVSLQAGETQTLTFLLPLSELAYYDKQSGTWKVEKMEYEVMVGPSSDKSNLKSTTVSLH